MNVVPATTPGIWPSISQNMYAMPSGLNRPISAAPVLRPNPAGMLFRPDSQFGNQYKPLLINNLPPTDKLIPTDKLPVEKIIAIACAISAAVTIIVAGMFYYAAIDGNTNVPVPPTDPPKYPSVADATVSRNFVYINSGEHQSVSPNNTVVVVGTALPGLTTKTTRGVKFSSIFTLAYNSTSCPCTFFIYRSSVGIITTANYQQATNLGQVGYKVASAYTVNATIHESVPLQYVDIPPSNGTWYYAVVCVVGVTSNNGTPIGFNMAGVPTTIAEEM